MTRRKSDKDLINAFGAAQKALVQRMKDLLADAEIEEDEGESARMEAEERAKAMKERARQIELVLEQSNYD
jgi:hypothetical protein